jgi:hypothetical protein
MNKNLVFWMTAWPAIALGACATLQPPRPPHPHLETAKACADWRWIGISRPGVSCPDIPGWTVQPLFGKVSPALQKAEDICAAKGSERGDLRTAKESEKVPGPEVIQELSRFCVYEAAHQGLAQPKSPPARSAELVRLDQDCADLASPVPRDPGVESAASSSYDFLREAGLPAEPLTIANPYGVRLAFLDTQPTSGSLPEWQGNSPHGYALAYIGKNLVCEGESCAARITTRLALPILEFNAKSPRRNRRDEHMGGYLGMQSDLAEAIKTEVDAWRSERRRGGSERHLVLNLSLAWDGELFGGLDEEQIAEMQAGTQAIYRALQYAAGFDALVLAAAGNAKAEPCANFGPLLPGAWEAGSVREESCREQPLLYAVGGLGASGFPLANARPGGMPRRAAYAENAVVPCPLASGYTTALTGSSVATAVASSIAADVWASFPELSASDVMNILDESGYELSIPADFWFGASASSASVRPKVHKLSLCAALALACARARSTSCPVQLPCDRPWRTSSALPGHSGPSPKRESCQPWLSPQPESPPCPTCGPPY